MSLESLQKLVDEATFPDQEPLEIPYGQNWTAIYGAVANQEQAQKDGLFCIKARTYMPLLIEVAKAAKIRNPLGEEEFYKMLEAQKRLDNALAALEKAE